MKNEGEVHGNASIEGSTEENGTGGIIGVNGYKADGTGANISNSSLMNRVNGNVSGVANVGGIIGINMVLSPVVAMITKIIINTRFITMVRFRRAHMMQQTVLLQRLQEKTSAVCLVLTAAR